MPASIVPESLNGDDDSRNTCLFPQDEPKEFHQIFRRALAGLAQQLTVTKKRTCAGFWGWQNVLTVRNREENRFLEVVAELNHFLVMLPQGHLLRGTEGQNRHPLQLNAKHRNTTLPHGEYCLNTYQDIVEFISFSKIRETCLLMGTSNLHGK